MTDNDMLYINGIDAETGQYLTAPMTFQEAARYVRGEPFDMGLVRFFKRMWRRLTRGHLGLPAGAHVLLDLLCEHGEVVVPDGPPLTGLADTGDDLGAAERFGDARAFDDGQGRGLARREAAVARRALAATPDRRAVVGGAAVDDAAVVVTTERAVHGRATSSR